MSKRRGEKKEIIYSDHHILPQHPFWTSLEWSSNSHNIIRIRDVKHRAIHTLFENFMIADQLLTCVNLSEKALLPEVKSWLVEVLTETIDPHNPELWYKDECII